MIRARAMPFRRFGRAAIVVLPALLSGVGAPGRATAEIVDRVVATVDGEPITAYELRRYTKERGGEDAPERQVLEALITDRLLEKEIKAQNINVKDDEIDRYIEEIRNRNGMNPEQFTKALAAQGMTLETYRARVKSEIERAQLVNREIRQRVNVSPEEIQRYYDAHKGEYSLDERVTVQDILFAVPESASADEVERVQKKAEEVRDLARQGKDFGALAKQFSEGPGADKGGDLGSFGRDQLDPDIAEVVFRMKPGEISDPVRTRAGFHVLRVRERAGAGQKPVGDVSDQIRDTLYNEALEQRFKSWLSRDLRERHHVEVLD